MTTRAHPVSPDAALAAHRDEFAEFLASADADTRWLLDLFTGYNRDHFAGELVAPYLLLAEPSAPQVHGDCVRDAYGLRGRIRIRPSLLAGTHPVTRRLDDDGRRRFVADVLLHELVHLWQFEVDGRTDDGYHGHGPAFVEQANRIGARLGLARVRTSKRRGPDRDLPSCAQWPHNVRPADHYGVPASRDPQAAPLDVALDRLRRDLARVQALLDQGEVLDPDPDLSRRLASLASTFAEEDPS